MTTDASGMVNGLYKGGKEGGAYTIIFYLVVVRMHHAEKNCIGLAARSLSPWIPQF